MEHYTSITTATMVLPFIGALISVVSGIGAYATAGTIIGNVLGSIAVCTAYNTLEGALNGSNTVTVGGEVRIRSGNNITGAPEISSRILESICPKNNTVMLWDARNAEHCRALGSTYLPPLVYDRDTGTTCSITKTKTDDGIVFDQSSRSLFKIHDTYRSLYCPQTFTTHGNDFYRCLMDQTPVQFWTPPSIPSTLPAMSFPNNTTAIDEIFGRFNPNAINERNIEPIPPPPRCRCGGIGTFSMGHAKICRECADSASGVIVSVGGGHHEDVFSMANSAVGCARKLVFVQRTMEEITALRNG